MWRLHSCQSLNLAKLFVFFFSPWQTANLLVHWSIRYAQLDQAMWVELHAVVSGQSKDRAFWPARLRVDSWFHYRCSIEFYRHIFCVYRCYRCSVLFCILYMFWRIKSLCMLVWSVSISRHLWFVTTTRPPWWHLKRSWPRPRSSPISTLERLHPKSCAGGIRRDRNLKSWGWDSEICRDDSSIHRSQEVRLSQLRHLPGGRRAFGQVTLAQRPAAEGVSGVNTGDSPASCKSIFRYLLYI